MATKAKPAPRLKISPELRLLRAFSGQPRALSRAELERATGLPQATVNRALQALVQRNVVRHVERGHRPTYIASDPGAVAQLDAAMRRLFPELAPRPAEQGEMPWTERLRAGRRQPTGAHRVDPALGADVDPAEREGFFAELPPAERADAPARAPFQGRRR